MIQIDGSAKSGSGTILRYAIALSSLLGEALHITSVRAKRNKPGLQPQHLAAVTACAQLCSAKVEGAVINSQELVYTPGKRITGGLYEWDIGTGGSTTMLVLSVLPLILFADEAASCRVSGGLFQDFAPSAYHIKHVLFPILNKMGIGAEIEILRPGYVPMGGGVIQVRVKPLSKGIGPLQLLNQGTVSEVKGIALSSHLKQRRVSERMAEECRKILLAKGYHARIDVLSDETALQSGANLSVWALTDTGCLLGTDRAGKLGRTSEQIARYVAHTMIEDLETGATVDRHLGDQLIIYAALASGTTKYIVPHVTEHVDTNLWLVEKFGAQTFVEGKGVNIKGIGYIREK